MERLLEILTSLHTLQIYSANHGYGRARHYLSGLNLASCLYFLRNWCEITLTACSQICNGFYWTNAARSLYPTAQQLTPLRSSVARRPGFKQGKHGQGNLSSQREPRAILAGISELAVEITTTGWLGKCASPSMT